MTAERFLRDLFESDRDASNYYQKFPLYEGDALIGTRPWLPPLSQVWAEQGVRPAWDTNPHWPEAWSLLETLHRDFLKSRQP